MNDFNVKIGSGKVAIVEGEYSLGDGNNSSDRLFEFCQLHGMIDTNTY